MVDAHGLRKRPTCKLVDRSSLLPSRVGHDDFKNGNEKAIFRSSELYAEAGFNGMRNISREERAMRLFETSCALVSASWILAGEFLGASDPHDDFTEVSGTYTDQGTV